MGQTSSSIKDDLQGGGVPPDILAKWTEDSYPYNELPIPDNAEDVVEIVEKIVGTTNFRYASVVERLKPFNSLLPQTIAEVIEKLSANTRTELNDMRNNYHGDPDDWWFAIPPKTSYGSLPKAFLPVFCQLSIKTDSLEECMKQFGAEDHWPKVAYESYMEPYYSLSGSFYKFYLNHLSSHPEEWFQKSLIWIEKDSDLEGLLEEILRLTDDKSEEERARLQNVVSVVDSLLTFRHWENYVKNNHGNISDWQKRGFFKDPFKFLGDMLTSPENVWEPIILQLINDPTVTFSDPATILAKVKTNGGILYKIRHPQLVALDPELFAILEAVRDRDDFMPLATTKRDDILNAFKFSLSQKKQIPENVVYAMYHNGFHGNLDFFMAANKVLATNIMSTLVKMKPRNYEYLEQLIKDHGHQFTDSSVYDQDNDLFYMHAKYGFAHDFNVKVDDESILLDVYSDVLAAMEWEQRALRVATSFVIFDDELG